ncbi:MULTISPECIES: efflux RND transporter periplasmic adaptor subunit [Spirulina sp. CCY15215]|uniref:efflux RND transporter periplasmic adaptor subunit n=1 Tax=Spirulina sp. CCY15215 TaxID=2767591 RepID=UPI00194F6652|nr:efflux RND transporter periplasmic adaptor subunit [Spirulina major]
MIFSARSRNLLPWLIFGIAGASIVGVGAITYNAVFGDTSELEQYTVLVEEESLRVQVKASGTVTPFQSVNISPKQAGILRQLLVEQGMQVEEGQPLAVMDNEEIRAQGLQAQANFQQAIANLQAAQTRIPQEVLQARARFAGASAGVREAQARIPTELNQANARVAAAEERYKRAKSRFERYQIPTQAGAVSENTFDDASIELRSAEAELFAAQQDRQREIGTERPEIEQLGASAREAQASLTERERTARAEVEQLQAAAAAARAQVQEVQVRFQDSLIRAPFKGIVTQRYATPGAFITPTTSASATASATSTSIVAIARGLEVLAKIPEIDVSQLQPRQPVEIVADAFPNKVFRGVVRLVAPEAVVEDNVTSFEIRIAVDPNQKELLSGMNVDVTFLGEQLARTLVIPTVAIVTQDGEKGVMVADDNEKPEFKKVVLGATLEDKTQVITGLQPGERVFIELPEKYQPKKEE